MDSVFYYILPSEVLKQNNLHIEVRNIEKWVKPKSAVSYFICGIYWTFNVRSESVLINHNISIILDKKNDLKLNL